LGHYLPVKKFYIFMDLRDAEKTNIPGLRRILIRIQGASKGAYQDI
jgi:hypothetical protein